MRFTSVLLVLFGMAFGLCAADDPVAYYKLNGDFKDSSGNGHDLTELGDGNGFSDAKPQRGADKYFESGADGSAGAGAEFDGLDPKKGLTLMGFYRNDEGNNFQCDALFGFGTGKWRNPAYLVTLPYGMINVKTGPTQQYATGARPKAKEWVHIALVLPAEVENAPEAMIYLNGERIYPSARKGTDQVPKVRYTYTEMPKSFRLGFFSSRKANGQANGKRLANVKIYNRALSEAEVRQEAAEK